MKSGKFFRHPPTLYNRPITEKTEVLGLKFPGFKLGDTSFLDDGQKSRSEVVTCLYQDVV